MDKLQAMEVFVQVVDAGNFTRASGHLQLSKATVSTLIRNLEADLSVRLLNRTTRRISVTADGATYYERCLSILADVSDAEDAVSSAQAGASGRLRVDVQTGLGRRIIIPALPHFLERHPGIRIEIGCSDRPADLVEEGIDCAVRVGTPADSTLIARRIGSLHFVICAPPSYIAVHGRPTHPHDLLQHQCINYFSSSNGKVLDWGFRKDADRIVVKVPGRIAVNDSDAYFAAALTGMGIARMPLIAIRPYLQSGEMSPLLQDWSVDPLPVHVVYSDNRHLPAKVRVFAEWIAKLFSDHDELHGKGAFALSGEQPTERLWSSSDGRVPVAQQARPGLFAVGL